jgi:hypothetical protein
MLKQIVCNNYGVKNMSELTTFRVADVNFILILLAYFHSFSVELKNARLFMVNYFTAI